MHSCIYSETKEEEVINPENTDQIFMKYIYEIYKSGLYFDITIKRGTRTNYLMDALD